MKTFKLNYFMMANEILQLLQKLIYFMGINCGTFYF